MGITRPLLAGLYSVVLSPTGMGICGKGGVWQASSKKFRAAWVWRYVGSYTGKPADVDNGGIAAAVAAGTLLGFRARGGGCVCVCVRAHARGGFGVCVWRGARGV